MASELTILENNLTQLSPQLADVLAGQMEPARLIRTVMISCERTPKLLNADRQSLFNGVMTFAVLGLEVDGVTGQGYLLPFNDKRKGLIAQPIVGYKGYSTLGARAGYSIDGAVVRDGDLFEYELGTSAFVRHKPKLGNTGRIIGAWACATSLSRPPLPVVLGIDDIMAIKARAPGAKTDASPWGDPAIGFPAMAAKSAKRRLARSLPLNVFQLAARMDEAFEEQGKPAYLTRERQLMIDGDVSPFPAAQTSETPSAQEILAPESQPIVAELREALRKAAEKGTAALKTEWESIHPKHKHALEADLRRTYQPRAKEVDKR